jgi:Amt family ammonium transporter
MTGVFANEAIGGTAGLLEGNMQQFINNTIGVFGTWIFAGIATFIILKIVDAITGLRVEESAEVDGLDIAEHGEEAYQL